MLQMNDQSINQLVILADESANWVVGGLRQLDRLVLAADEFALASSMNLSLLVFWNPNIPSSEHWLPKRRRITRDLQLLDERGLPSGNCLMATTRLLIARSGLSAFFEKHRVNIEQTTDDPASAWQQLNDEFESSLRRNGTVSSDCCRLISNQNQLSAGENWLLRTTGKSYDGLVSRYLNRPISRLVSRIVLPFPVTPNQWTLGILLFAVAACWFLSRGSYTGFVIGAAFYQLHSVLDGCDGEIARIKYLDSKRGPGIDALGDLIALLLFVAGLTAGLFHYANGNARWMFLGEGVIAFILIAFRLGRHTVELLARGMDAVRASEHDSLLRESGDHFFGRNLNSLAIAITRRDVVFLAFLLLALVRLAPLIMHLLFIYSLGAVLLLLKGRSMRSSRQVRPVLP